MVLMALMYFHGLVQYMREGGEFVAGHSPSTAGVLRRYVAAAIYVSNSVGSKARAWAVLRLVDGAVTTRLELLLCKTQTSYITSPSGSECNITSSASFLLAAHEQAMLPYVSRRHLRSSLRSHSSAVGGRATRTTAHRTHVCFASSNSQRPRKPTNVPPTPLPSYSQKLP